MELEKKKVVYREVCDYREYLNNWIFHIEGAVYNNAPEIEIFENGEECIDYELDSMDNKVLALCDQVKEILARKEPMMCEAVTEEVRFSDGYLCTSEKTYKGGGELIKKFLSPSERNILRELEALEEYYL